MFSASGNIIFYSDLQISILNASCCFGTGITAELQTYNQACWVDWSLNKNDNGLECWHSPATVHTMISWSSTFFLNLFHVVTAKTLYNCNVIMVASHVSYCSYFSWNGNKWYNMLEISEDVTMPHHTNFYQVEPIYGEQSWYSQDFLTL